MELNPGYKRTEVGVIPVDWVVKSVGEISNVKTGPFGSALHEKDYVEDGTPIITVEHLGEQGVLHINIPMVSDEDKTRLNTYSLEQYDIVFSRVGSVDRNAIITADEDGWLFSGRLLRVRLKKKDINASYLSYHFHSEAFRNRVREVAVGQTMASLNTRILSGVKTILPPSLAEQQAIAEALSDADAWIESFEQLIAKKRQIKQGAMQELLSGKNRLAEFTTKIGYKQSEVGVIPKDWIIKDLGNICGKITTGKLDANAMKPDGKYRFYTCAKDYYLIDIYAFDTEALLISGNGENVGYVHYYKGKFNAYQRTYVLSEFLESIEYLRYYMDQKLSDRIRIEVKAGNTPYITMGTLTEMKIALPPNKAEQQAIATILVDMDAEITALEEKLVKARQIKQGMMQELLTGRIRLI